VVVDGNLVTSIGGAVSYEGSLALLERIAGPVAADRVAEKLYYFRWKERKAAATGAAAGGGRCGGRPGSASRGWSRIRSGCLRPSHLALLIWLAGGVGVADAQMMREPSMVALNAATAGMDLVAIALAIAFTHAWGMRIPAGCCCRWCGGHRPVGQVRAGGALVTVYRS
jgi:hypothetical protein